MKISIITVCLNSERTIDQTIQSVIGQNFEDCEYIVIDGCSTDSTLKILDKYKKDISIIISEQDNGIYDAMNKGISLATGDIIGIINSDDWYEPGAFKIISKHFEESDAEVVYGNVNVWKENGELEDYSIANSLERIRTEMSISHPSVFIKKDVYARYGAFHLEYTICADYELLLRFYSKGVKFICIDKILANFRRGGISGKQVKKSKKETLEIALNYLSYAPLTERSYLKILLIHRWKAFYFEYILYESAHLLPDILITKLGVGILDDIVIFGAGKWGMKMHDILSQKKMRPLFIVDNDEKKWNQKKNIRPVYSPANLKKFKGILLIMVREFSSEILSQVEDLHNPEIYCILWDEIADSCILTENFNRVTG